MNEKDKDCKCASIEPPEDYTLLKMIDKIIVRLIKVIVIMAVVWFFTVVSFLVFIHNTKITETTTLTTDAEITGVNTGKDSTITKYPKDDTNK